MLEGGRISPKQLILLVFINRIIIAITYLPVLMAPPANQDAWLSVVLMVPIELLLSGPVYLLAKRFPDQTIIQYSQTIVGKAGKLIGILYIWLFIHFTAITLSYFCEFFNTASMPETPFLFFAISLIIFAAYAAHSGIEVVGRISEIVAPIFMIAIMIFAILLVKEMDLKALTPVMEKGLFPSLHGGLYASTLTIEIVGIAMLLPYLNDQQKAKGVFIYSFLLISIFFLLITITVLSVYGAQLAKNHTFPFFSTVRQINVADFLERLDSINIAIWSIGMYVKIAFYYYLTAFGTAQLLNLKDYKPLVLPVGSIIVPLTVLISPNYLEVREFTSYRIFTWYSVFFLLVIPSILLLTAIIRKKGERQG